MLSRSSPASSMQKTYDECYLICSTAVYFEKQNNEDEALRSWRSALDAIYYHNAYRIPANYKPKSETERALQESLRDMELQCKERVDLLDALKKSREESKDDASNGGQPLPPSAARDTLPTPNPSSSLNLGRGTVPPVNYPDIARPPLPQRPAPQPRQASSSSALLASDGVRQKSSSSGVIPPRKTPSPSPALDVPSKKQSRTPSPDKKPGLLRSTLRGHGSGPSKAGPSGKLTAASLRPRPPANASKAATLAWPGAPTLGRGQSGATETAVHSPSRPSFGRKVSSNNAADTLTANLSASNGPPSPRLPLQKLRPKKARSSNVGAGMQAGTTPDPEHTPPPPTPPPHREPVSGAASQEHLNGLPSPLPVPEFPAYRREYSSAAPSIDPKQAQRMAANLHGNLSAHSPSAAASSIQRRHSPGRKKSPVRKRPPPPVPRKAIGSPTTRKSFPTRERAPSDLVSSSDPEPEPLSSTESALTETEAEVIAELGGNDEDEGKAQNAAWDARVKQLMKNLPKGVDEQAAKAIFNEVVIQGDEVHWDDVAGLDIAKNALKEAVVYPFLRPDLFRGLREPARGMLLFGPPGTGKTMLARAVATESRSTFFAISASSLTSKYLGESEKLVRALFAIAKVLTPSIIFVDEIDSLLSARSGSGEHEATRRIKTEFLIQWSDLAKAAAGRDDKDKSAGDASRVLVLAATNLPWAIDEAARRRFVRRQYIPLPEAEVRESQLRRLLSAQKTSLHDKELAALVILTDGYSGSDITALAKDAAMGPLRSLGEKLLHMSPEDIRPISMDDFEASLVNIRPSVSKEGLQEYDDWARQFGERGG